MLPALDKMRAAGFEVALSAAGGLMIRPIDRLTAAQRQWLKANRAALLAALANERPSDRPPDVVGMVGLVGLGQTDRDVHLPAPRPPDVVGMVGLVGLGQTDRDVHLPAPRPPDVVGMVALVGLGQTDRDVHLPAPRPVAAPVRCIDCAHSSRADQYDELGAWRLCSAGNGGRFAYQEHWCTAWAATAASESESQPPPPKLAARQTPEQRQQCFDARVAEFMRAGMTLDDATAATAKEGW